MFGKPRDIHDTDILDTSALDEFFGDEAAAENSVEIHDLRDRVKQVESQISSQFTSLATYAQIAHEQVELARSESKAATERSEHRLTSLIERERADRITASTGPTDEGWSEFTSRLDALECSVVNIQNGLDECRQQQHDLAVVISTVFERLAASTFSATQPVAMTNIDVGAEPAPLAFAPPTTGTAVGWDADGIDGPISALALNA